MSGAGDQHRHDDRPVGFGVIGARSMIATQAVLPAIDAADGARVAAVATRSGSIAAPWSALAVADYDDVLQHPDVEAVYVPLPNSMHREWVERAAAAGKHVLCEKPLGATAAEAAATAAACAAAGVLLAEAWMTPFDPRWSEALRLVREGAVGELRAIDAAFTFTLPPSAADNYRWDPALGGGALLDVGIYCVGPAAELWGTDPTTVEASVLTTARGVDATTAAELRWEDGRVARARCSFVEDDVQRLEYVGTTGRLVLDGDAHTGGARARRMQWWRTDGAGTTGHGAAPESIDVVADDPYRGMVERFAAAVRGTADWPRPASRAVDLAALLDRIRAEAAELPAP